MATLAERMQRDAQFFDSMLHLVPASYIAPPEQDTNNKFTHSKSVSISARQSMKENSKAGQKVKAKFDPKNYTSVLTNGKKAAAADSDEDEEDDEDEDMEGDEQDDDEDEAGEDDDDEDDEAAAPKAKANSKANAKPAAAAAAAAAGKKPSAASAAAATNGHAAKPAPSTSSSGPLLAGAPLSTLLPVPSLSALSADVGMDQLRQRLHERINGLSQKRKPEDHPFAKKRFKKDDAAKKREKNTDKASQHKNKKRPAGEAEEPSAKKSKPSPAASAASSLTSPKPTSAAAAALPAVASNDFQFAALKSVGVDPFVKSGSYSLQGQQQRKKAKSDESLLKEVESFEHRLKDLKKAGDVDQAKHLEKERSMENAILRASGVKVRDDKTLLKKSLKRAEKSKEKSRAEWAERTAAAKSTQDAFHKEKIASAAKKQKGDRTRAGTTQEQEAAKEKAAPKEKTGRMSAQGRAGFEGKGKKFLN